MTDTKTPAPVAAPVLDSPALQTLKAEKKALWAELIKHEDPDTKEALDAKMNVWKKDGEIKAEIQRLEKEAADQKIAEQRNIRLGLNTAQLNAYDNLNKVRADKKSTPEQISAAQTAFDTAKELVDNELLAKYAKSSPAKADGAAKAEKGEKGAKTDEVCFPLFAEGKTAKEVEEITGIPRSTVWFSSDRYKKQNGTK